MASDRTVVALFARSEDAHRAINKLIDSGVSRDRIGYLEPVDEQDMKNPGTTAGKGIAAGAASGAVIGGLLAAAGRAPPPPLRPPPPTARPPPRRVWPVRTAPPRMTPPVRPSPPPAAT